MWGRAGRRTLPPMDRTTNGVGVDVVADAATTHGAYTLIDARLAAGASLDPHVVERETIALWVLAGALTVVVDGVPHALAPGDHLRLAPRLPRALRATTDARVLGLIVPAISARLALAAADRSLSADDRAAWLAAADVRLLPRSLWGTGSAARGPRPAHPQRPPAGQVSGTDWGRHPTTGHGRGRKLGP